MAERFSKDLIELAAKVYTECGSGNEVARRLEVSHSTAYRLLAAGGVSLPDRHGSAVQEKKKKLHGEKAKEAAADYAGGMGKKELCEKYGVGWWAIRTAARDHGISFRCRGGRFRKLTVEEGAEAVRLYRDEKLSQAQVALKVGCSQAVVGRLLVGAGVKIHKTERVREKHGSWKGGRTKAGSGYMQVHVLPNDPMWCMASSAGYILEHRLVMARALGRPLGEHETVHHLDGDKMNNALSNLQLRFGKHGKGVALKCRCCGSSDIVTVEL